MTEVPADVTAFEQHRDLLAGLAYRMLGSVAEAEDVVQDAFLRWRDEHVRDEQPRYRRSDDDARKLADAFLAAAASGDVDGLARVLADDVVLYTDGGGKRRAALKPIVGKAKVVRFYEGIKVKGGGFAEYRAEPTTLNGLPGFVFHTGEGTETLAFEVVEGRIVAVYAVRNPDKVRHLS